MPGASGIGIMEPMKRYWVRALQGLALSVGSPLGWLLLQWLGGADPWLQLVWSPGIYLYLLLGTAFAFSSFGWYAGWQEEQFREHSLHDSLTGLYNRRYFWRRLGDELAFAHRHARPLSLLVGDLDLFKRVNDTYGHPVGDKVLAAVAGALMSLRRRGDTVARVGGEEFAVILPETDAAEARRVAERLREAVAGLSFEVHGAAEAFTITMSFGSVTALPGDPMAADAVFNAADLAMYRAKQAGRNCVVAASAVVVHDAPPPGLKAA